MCALLSGVSAYKPTLHNFSCLPNQTFTVYILITYRETFNYPFVFYLLTGAQHALIIPILWFDTENCPSKEGALRCMASPIYQHSQVMKRVQYTYIQTFSTEFVLMCVSLYTVALTSLVFSFSKSHYTLSIHSTSSSPFFPLCHKFRSFI
jgi:hypothetical protein